MNPYKRPGAQLIIRYRTWKHHALHNEIYKKGRFNRPLPKTNIAPENMPGQKRKIPLPLKFREGILML